jgi:3-dehydroquinate synthase
MSSSDDLRRLQDLAANHGPRALVLTRALPVLAEATVLMFGAAKLPWRQFWPAVLLANLGLAIAYATLGWLGKTEGAALWALYASILIPIVATLAARWWWPARE